MKKLMTSGRAGFASVALLALGLAASAHAQLITLTSGDFTINANGFSATTIFSQAPGALQVNPGPAATLEDLWGIFQISSIIKSGSPVFTDNGGTEYWGIFYNSYDTSSTVVGPNIIFTSLGLKLDIYKVMTADVGDLAWLNVYKDGPNLNAGARTALNAYDGISNAGSLVLSSSLVGTMTNAFFGTNSTIASNGVVHVNTNNMFDVGGGTLSDLTFALAGVTNNVPFGWTVSFGGPITGNVAAVPEPSTYGLIAAGALLGLVAFRRIKVRAQAI